MPAACVWTHQRSARAHSRAALAVAFVVALVACLMGPSAAHGQALDVTISVPTVRVSAPVRPVREVVVTPAPHPKPVPAGQWVYTQQYGWLYLPYAQSYTFVPAAGTPRMYVYYPSFGWRWVHAPWVVGIGPAPYWGPHGIVHFSWHARPWFARPVIVHPVHHAHVYIRR